MPSSDNQMVAWLLAIFTPIYLIGKLLGWLGEVLAEPWRNISMVVGANVDTHHIIHGNFGYVLFAFVFVFPFVAKKIFTRPDSKISALSITLPITGVIIFTILNWGFVSANFAKWSDGNQYLGYFRFNVITGFFIVPLLGGMAFVFVSIHAVLRTLRVVILTGVALTQFALGTYSTLREIYYAVRTAFAWVVSPFSKKGRQEWGRKTENERMYGFSYEDIFEFIWPDKEEKTHSQSNNNSHGFDASRFKGSAPYGVDKHHVDDSHLWDIVNDPAASEGEQRNAISAIKKREAKRIGKTSNIGATQTA